jgi:hypothetical protein
MVILWARSGTDDEATLAVIAQPSRKRDRPCTPWPLVELRAECKYLIGLAVGEDLACPVRVKEEASV